MPAELRAPTTIAGKMSIIRLSHGSSHKLAYEMGGIQSKIVSRPTISSRPIQKLGIDSKIMLTNRST